MNEEQVPQTFFVLWNAIEADFVCVGPFSPHLLSTIARQSMIVGLGPCQPRVCFQATLLAFMAECSLATGTVPCYLVLTGPGKWWFCARGRHRRWDGEPHGAYGARLTLVLLSVAKALSLHALQETMIYARCASRQLWHLDRLGCGWMAMIELTREDPN